MALLSALMANNRLFDFVAAFLRPEHFADPRHGRIFDAIVSMIETGRAADPVTLKARFEHDGSLADIGGVEYLARLAGALVSTINAVDYGRVIHDAWARRELIDLSSEVLRAAYHPADGRDATALISDADDRLYALAESGDAHMADAVMRLGAAADRALADAEEAHRKGAEGHAIGITTGFVDLDRKLGGLERGCVYIIGGRPSMGKSALALWGAWRAASAGHRGVIFSLEMTAAQIGRRYLGPLVGLSPQDVKTGAVPDENTWSRLLATKAELAALPLHIVDRPNMSMAQIRSIGRTLKRRGGLDFVVIDHLGLVAVPPEVGKQGPTAMMAYRSNYLRILAKELDAPVVALCQLNRATEGRDDKRPTLADLKQSGDIEQDADVVIFVYREEYYVSRAEPKRREGESDESLARRSGDWMARSAEVAHLAELIIAKQRDGPIGIVQLFYDETTARFQNLHKG